MVIKATIYKLTAPNETDKCLIANTTGTVARAVQMIHECYCELCHDPLSRNWLPHYEFITKPSLKAKVSLRGEFKTERALRTHIGKIRRSLDNDYITCPEFSKRVAELEANNILTWYPEYV